MIGGLSDRVLTYRWRGWRVRAAVLGAVLVLAAIVVMAWRRRAAERAAHELFVAQVDARAAADAATAAADAARVAELTAAAELAADRAAAAAVREQSARRNHDQDLAAIDRVRSWDDVRRQR